MTTYLASRIPFHLAGVVLLGFLSACGDTPERQASVAQPPAASATPSSAAPPAPEAGEDEPVNLCSPDSPPEEIGLEGRPPRAGTRIITIDAVSYAFEGIPTTLTAGEYGFVVRGTGPELYEMALVRKRDPRPILDLLDLPHDGQEFEEALPYLGGVAVCPGKESEAVGARLRPGTYALVSFIPAGYTPQLTGDDLLSIYEEPAQYLQGMVAELRVTE